jgi:aminoglycoside phosphotransferase family enzyme
MGRVSCPRLLSFYTARYPAGTEGQPEEEKSCSYLSMLIFRLEKTALLQGRRILYEMARKTINQALLNPETYPHKPQKIELVQTQMSFIFLTGEYVYKIKKPVNLGYLDYTTLEKRHFFCHQELELNRRLCPDVYLGVVPIIEKKGELRIEELGKAIEYAVKMKQLPQDRMMNVLLPRGQVTREMVARVAEKLVSFHQKAETSQKIAAFGKLDVICQNTDENFAQTEKYIGISIPATKYAQIKGYTEDFITSNSALFDKRVRGGKIRDCHGDLHAAHVCFTDDICIYDCIEFNDRFRYCDVASEIAFLAMDLDRYQHSSLSRHLVNAYVRLSHDEELMKLLNFYKCYRAYVRGKVEGFKLDDPLISQTEKSKALANARSYFQLAESYM